METVVVSGVVHSPDEAKITLQSVPDVPGVASKIFKRIADASINVDVIVQNISQDGLTDMSFTVKEKDKQEAIRCAHEAAEEIGGGEVIFDDKIAKVSVVGVGMRTHYGVAAKMFQALAEKGVNIMMITTSEIRISCIISRDYTELAVRSLCEAFGLTD
jgi:aspartate kinase